MTWIDDYLPVSRGELNRRLKSLWDYALSQTEHITKIGETAMARVDEVVARLGAATDEIARDLDALRQEVAGLDESVAAKFEPLVNRLEQMGQDPQNPVPDAPVDGDAGAGTDGEGPEVVNPTPDAQDNPDNR
jgi:phage repressor protein C with HTH and peptisase S24 domain